MGNQLSAPPRFQPEHLQELNKVVYKQSLGRPNTCILASAALYVTLGCKYQSQSLWICRRRSFAEDCAVHPR